MSKWMSTTADLAAKTKIDVIKSITQNIDLLMLASEGQCSSDKIWASKSIEGAAASVALLALQDLIGLQSAMERGECPPYKRRTTIEGIASAVAFATTWIACESGRSDQSESLSKLEVKLRGILLIALMESGLFKDEDLNSQDEFRP